MRGAFEHLSSCALNHCEAKRSPSNAGLLSDFDNSPPRSSGVTSPWVTGGCFRAAIFGCNCDVISLVLLMREDQQPLLDE